MKFPRVSIGTFMFAMAMLSIPFALLRNVMNGSLMTSPVAGTDMGLWPTLMAFCTAAFLIAKDRGKRSPFLWGFAVVGWASVLIYLGLCFWVPDIVAIPDLYYLNDLDYWWIVWLIDLQDELWGYTVNLLIRGLILATPELMMATLGGLIARWIWGKRWSTT